MSSFTYNQENFMTAAGASVSYVYDAEGRRVRKTAGSTVTEYFYAGAELISEKQGSTWTDYVFFDGQRIAKQTGSTAASAVYLHTDHLRSTRVCTDANGNSTGTCDYEPFGEIQPGSSCSVPTNFRFAGMEWDSDAGPNGLYHTLFRQYDPNQGRWMSVDPLSGTPDDPQSLNRYPYVGNDPVNFTDPLGLSHACPVGCTPVHSGHPDNPSPAGCSCPGGNQIPPGQCISVYVDGFPQGTVCPNSTHGGECLETFSYSSGSQNCTVCIGRYDATVSCSTPQPPKQDFASCVQANRFDNALRNLGTTFDLPGLSKAADYTLTSSVDKLQFNVTSAVVTGQLGGNLVASLAVPFTHTGPVHSTSVQHWAGSLISRATGSPVWGNAGKFLGRLASVPSAALTVGEGAYNGTTMVTCALNSLLH
ncbi:MAG: RHS repeat-associated core domain-containing protein [Acidobacteria bacterium]|nr:RHS repeat-associated core domain-containing protein [Acidobacteriota bacterium]